MSGVSNGGDVPSTPSGPLEIRPVTKSRARAFINEHHRHNEAPSRYSGVTFAIGLYDGDDLVGVLTAAHPVARHLNDGFTLEINRTCLMGEVSNGNSRLYGAACRAAKAIGYRKVITYTLQDESGSSLLAAGFTRVRDVPAQQWSRPSRPRYNENLFGERQNAAGVAKWRWERVLVREGNFVGRRHEDERPTTVGPLAELEKRSIA